jgi:hypothetical protein
MIIFVIYYYDFSGSFMEPGSYTKAGENLRNIRCCPGTAGLDGSPFTQPPAEPPTGIHRAKTLME